MEWNIHFIVGGCSFLLGIASGGLVYSCKKLCNRKNRDGNSLYDDVLPRQAKEGLRGGWNKEMVPAHVYDLHESGNARCHELSKFRKKNQSGEQISIIIYSQTRPEIDTLLLAITQNNSYIVRIMGVSRVLIGRMFIYIIIEFEKKLAGTERNVNANNHMNKHPPNYCCSYVSC